MCRSQSLRKLRLDASEGTKAPAAIFVATPRTIRDITAILDSEKPNLTRIAARKDAASMNPPAGASASELAQFYYNRGNARAALGRVKDSIDDANKAVEVARGKVDGGPGHPGNGQNSMALFNPSETSIPRRLR
jgi:hypothetical protein